MNTPLKSITRIICILSALVLFYVITLPIWRIELAAPQYPEGLVLSIYADKLAGDVQVINGLNHYIGMRTLHTEDFIEFSLLPYIIGAFGLFGILTALVNRKWFFFTWVGFLILFGVIALVDFYRWNYNYGHNLDPEAPIQVPGMSYQPPLLGYKQLLNFGAYSIPDIGGWLFIGVYVLVFVFLYLEIRTILRVRHSTRPMAAITILCLLFVSCSTNPRKIKPGVDGCTFCKMTITDPRFAAELVTSTGKIFVFDDLHCLQSYHSEQQGKFSDAKYYVVDFKTGDLISSKNAHLVKSEQSHSPMGSNTIAFGNESDQNEYLRLNPGSQVAWQSIIP